MFNLAWIYQHYSPGTENRDLIVSTEYVLNWQEFGVLVSFRVNDLELWIGCLFWVINPHINHGGFRGVRLLMCPRSSSFASPGWRSFRTCFWKLLCRSSDSLLWIWWRCEQVKTQNGPTILERAGILKCWSCSTPVFCGISFGFLTLDLRNLSHCSHWSPLWLMSVHKAVWAMCVQPKFHTPSFWWKFRTEEDQLLWFPCMELGTSRLEETSEAILLRSRRWIAMILHQERTMHEISWMPDGWPEKLKYLAARLSTCQWRFWRQTQKHHLLKIFNFDGWPTIFVFPILSMTHLTHLSSDVQVYCEWLDHVDVSSVRQSLDHGNSKVWKLRCLWATNPSPPFACVATIETLGVSTGHQVHLLRPEAAVTSIPESIWLRNFSIFKTWSLVSVSEVVNHHWHCLKRDAFWRDLFRTAESQWW